MNAPQPADEEFEQGLTWSPSRIDERAAVAPAVVSRSAPVSAAFAPDGTEELLELRRNHLQLREDVAGLRAAVLEWPELDRVAAQVAEVRASTAELAQVVGALVRRSDVDDLRGQMSQLMVLAKEAVTSSPELGSGSEIDGLREQVRGLQVAAVTAAGEQSASVHALGDLIIELRREMTAAREELTALREAPRVPSRLPAMAPMLEELVEIRDEITQLKRRIALRSNASGLDAATVERIADAVAERFSDLDED